jgi:CHAT domain-containing protein
VTTLVGTLWRVKDEVSHRFFVRFYEQIHACTPMLDAFVFAQRATRDAFPQYRNWGAFYFAGDWGDCKIQEEEEEEET